MLFCFIRLPLLLLLPVNRDKRKPGHTYVHARSHGCINVLVGRNGCIYFVKTIFGKSPLANGNGAQHQPANG